MPRLFLPLALGFIGLTLVLSYAPGLHGPFLFDDFQNFIQRPAVMMKSLDLDSALSAMYSWKESTLPNRALSRLSLGLNYYFSGGRFDAYQMKVTNLVVHFINSLLVLLLTRRLVASRLGATGDGDRSRAGVIAFIAAAIWALHPIQLTAVLYVVQRMTSMAATFVLLGLLCYAIGRQRLEKRPVNATLIMLIGMGACVGVGFFFKQNVVLLAPMALLCELFFFRREGLGAQARWGLRWVFGLSVVVPLVAAIAVSPWILEWIQGDYGAREFDAWQRLLTQSRVIALYLGLIFVPRLQGFSIWRDDIAISSDFWTPISTAYSSSLILLSIVAALWAIRRRHLWAFAVLFFFTGHLIESTVVALELVFEHRNYVPMVAVSIAVAWYLVRAADRLDFSRVARYLVVAALLLSLGFITHNRARVWRADLVLAKHLVEHHPDSYRAHALHAKSLASRRSDAHEIYAAYVGAAKTPAQAVFPLIRMRRLIAAVLFQYDQGNSVDVSPVPAPMHYTDEFVLNRAYLQSLAGLVHAEIRRRMREGVPNIETLIEIDQVRLCLDANLDLCWKLRDEAETWVREGLASGRASEGARLRLLLFASIFTFHGGDVAGALELLESLGPDAMRDIGVKEQQVVYLARLGRFDEAQQLLHTLEPRAKRDPDVLERLIRGREFLERVRSESTTR